MKVTYIYHSCYLLEANGISLLFDFYKDVEKENGSMWIQDYLLNKKDQLYIFCTHSHADHFNPEILKWKTSHSNITYIFSSELAESQGVEQDVVYLKKGQTFKDDKVCVKAFGSTDIGGSFLVETHDKKVFHAGDLNNWHWNEEVTKFEAAGFETNYLCELELLAEEITELDLAMFPIDPRLGKDYMKGANQFVKRIVTDYFAPMHFGEEYDKVNAFEKQASLQNTQYLKIKHKGQSYNLK